MGTWIVPERVTKTSPPSMTFPTSGRSSNSKRPDLGEHMMVVSWVLPSSLAQYGVRLVWDDPFTCATQGVRPTLFKIHATPPRAKTHRIFIDAIPGSEICSTHSNE